MNGDGKMDLNEFSVACKLINLKLKGMEMPKTLPPQLLQSGNLGGMMQPPNSLPLHGGMGMPGNYHLCWPELAAGCDAKYLIVVRTGAASAARQVL